MAGLGIIETSSGELEAVKGEIQKMRTLTDKPFGVNVALAFVRAPGIVNFIIDQGVKFVTTPAGDPQKIVAPLKAAGRERKLQPCHGSLVKSPTGCSGIFSAGCVPI